MRYIKTILILALLSNCNRNRIEDSIWITEDYLSCPYVFQFTEDLMWSNLTNGTFFQAYQYKIADNKLILNLISDNIFNVPMPDTLDFFIQGDKLTIDTFSYVRIDKDVNYYQSILSKLYHGFELPCLDYDNKIERCSSNSIVIPKQQSDSIEFYINGNKLGLSNISDLGNFINHDDGLSWYTVRFLIDGSVNHETLNIIRQELRKWGLLRQDFIFNRKTKDIFYLFDTYGLATRGMPVTENEYKEIEKLYDSDSSSNRKPLPPPPPPILFDKQIDKEKFVSIKIPNAENIIYNGDTITIDRFGVDQIRQIIEKDLLIMLQVNDKIQFSQYLDFRLKINQIQRQLRDSISLDWYKENYNNLVYEKEDSINDITRIRLFEVNQYFDNDRELIRSKYGL